MAMLGRSNSGVGDVSTSSAPGRPPEPESNSMEALLQSILDQECKNLRPAVPKPPNKCPLFCCFYSEFDIKIGPAICFESPKGFMNLDVHQVSTEGVHKMLSSTFEELAKKFSADCDAEEAPTSTEPPSGTEPIQTAATTATNPANNTAGVEKHHKPRALSPTRGNSLTKETAPTTSPTPANYRSSNQPTGGLSIFDSTCEYIITGSELTSKIITLSTHAWHIMSRPTMIVDSRYERNSHLFAVGMVLRRAADPNLFRPAISKLALTLEAMEKESMFLTSPRTRPQIQSLLDNVLLSLNSSSWECNLLLTKSNVLHLKLYQQPKPEASPVHDFQVPVLLRRDVQLQMYDWDLAINWVILHIDSVANARQISVKAEVDMEMVRACLRVLKHHGIITLVSPFSYSNRYEFTPRATAMLAGKEPKLLQMAMEFVLKRGALNPSIATRARSPGTTMFKSGSAGASEEPLVGSDSGPQRVSSPISPSSYGHMPLTPSSSYPPRTMGLLGGSLRSNHFRSAMANAPAQEKEPSRAPEQERGMDQRLVKAAIAKLYCACSRNLSFGDLWISLVTEVPVGLVVPNMGLGSATKGQGLRSRPRGKGSITDEHGEPTESSSFGMSPSESLHLESLRRTQGSKPSESSSSTPIDWNELFNRIDHRRFFTFGQIHGLVTRIHNYPCYPYSSWDTPLPPVSSTPHDPVARSQTTLSGTTSSADISVSSAIDPGTPTHLASDGFASGNSAIAVGGAHSPSKRNGVAGNTRDGKSEQQQRELAQEVLSWLDGTRCDDELACAFERPFTQLVDMVEAYGGHKVISLFAERPSD
eukprot:Nitzschia sp. Nitz4//scaffold286_size23798//583//3103//NITZ4_008445-RA/size23798-augustus-gene-0.11-mRNA-1//1//CDS//3329545723//2291//frame0